MSGRGGTGLDVRRRGDKARCQEEGLQLSTRFLCFLHTLTVILGPLVPPPSTMSGSMAPRVPEMMCRRGWKSMWLTRRMSNMMSRMPWSRVYSTCSRHTKHRKSAQGLGGGLGLGQRGGA